MIPQKSNGFLQNTQMSLETQNRHIHLHRVSPIHLVTPAIIEPLHSMHFENDNTQTLQLTGQLENSSNHPFHSTEIMTPLPVD